MTGLSINRSTLVRAMVSSSYPLLTLSAAHVLAQTLVAKRL